MGSNGFLAILSCLQDGATEVFLAGPELATLSFLYDLQLRLDSGPLSGGARPKKREGAQNLSLLH